MKKCFVNVFSWVLLYFLYPFVTENDMRSTSNISEKIVRFLHHVLFSVCVTGLFEGDGNILNHIPLYILKIV